VAQVGVLRWAVIKNGNGPMVRQRAEVLH